MKVVIVGGVAGGASAAARIRRLDEHAQIIMIERSGYVSYACLLYTSLFRAEAYLMTNKADLATADLNRIRKRATVALDVYKRQVSNPIVWKEMSVCPKKVEYPCLIIGSLC